MAELDCASCEDHVCRDGVDCYDAADHVKNLYAKIDPLSRKLLQTAAEIEAEGYMHWPRAQEILRFAKAAGFSHLGVAFCVGLHQEANTYVELLSKHFDVSSVCCKVCGIPKSAFGLVRLDPQNVQEALCSPPGQAELNIVMGLCVGHDALFTKNSAAPVTTLIAKDRVLAHNPVGALYSRYWRKRLDVRGGGA